MYASPEQDEESKQQACETSTAGTDLVRKSPLRAWASALFVLLVPSNQNSNRFSDRELEHLRFVRWLYQTGRLAS